MSRPALSLAAPAAPEAGRAERLVRFVAVGVLNTVFGYCVYAALVLARAEAQVALAGQFTLGVIWNFATHSRYVFGTKGFGRLPLYVAAYVAIWALNAFALEAVMSAGLSALAAQALLMPGTVALAYVLVGAALGVRRAP